MRFLGSYKISITSEFMQPRIDGSSEAVQQTSEFDLIVQPCQIISFDSSTEI